MGRREVGWQIRRALVRMRWLTLALALATGVLVWARINQLNQQVAQLTPNIGQGPSASAGTCGTSSCGTIINVPAGGNLQTAINSANLGDTISLAAGATYTGSFRLPNKVANGSAYLTITTAGFSIPAGQRVKPSDASQMAKLTNSVSTPIVLTAPSANHYQLIGLEIAPSGVKDFVNDVIRLGDVGVNQNTLPQVPHDLIVDRDYIHAAGTSVGAKRGIALNSSNTSIINSYISDFKETGQDTQAICGWNGPGNVTIRNNYLEAAGENVLLGGADPSIPGLAVNVGMQISNNYFFKPYTWMKGNPAYAGIAWNIKNLFESKNAQNLIFDGNLLQNSWLQGQNGPAITVKSSDQGGSAPQSVSQNQSYTNNIIEHVGILFQVFRTTNANALNVGTNHITFTNNLAEDVSKTYGGYGYAAQNSGATDFITMSHNTIQSDGNIFLASGNPSAGFIMQDNIIAHNQFGIIGTGRGPGDPTISVFFPGAKIDHNVFPGGKASNYKLTAANNFFPSVAFSTLFVNAAAGDFHLIPGTTFRGAATDGTDIGVNYTTLLAAQANSSAAVPTSTGGSTGTGGSVAPVPGAPDAGSGTTTPPVTSGSDTSAAPSPDSGTSVPTTK